MDAITLSQSETNLDTFYMKIKIIYGSLKNAKAQKMLCHYPSCHI